MGRAMSAPNRASRPVQAIVPARAQRSHSMRTTARGNSPSEREPIRLTAARRPGSSISLACNLCARSAARSLPKGKDRRAPERVARTRPACVAVARTRLRDPQRAPLTVVRPRLLFLANLLRFLAFRLIPAQTPGSSPSATPCGFRSARDWLEKTEDWQVKTGRRAQSLLSGHNTFIEDAVWLCRTEAEVAL
jgi:hypothetical protein